VSRGSFQLYMPNSIYNIINKFISLKPFNSNSMQIKYPKNWLIFMLIAFILMGMLIIIKHYNADNDLQQKIYDHSEIKDTV